MRPLFSRRPITGLTVTRHLDNTPFRYICCDEIRHLGLLGKLRVPWVDGKFHKILHVDTRVKFC